MCGREAARCTRVGGMPKGLASRHRRLHTRALCLFINLGAMRQRMIIGSTVRRRAHLQNQTTRYAATTTAPDAMHRMRPESALNASVLHAIDRTRAGRCDAVDISGQPNGKGTILCVMTAVWTTVCGGGGCEKNWKRTMPNGGGENCAREDAVIAGFAVSAVGQTGACTRGCLTCRCRSRVGRGD